MGTMLQSTQGEVHPNLTDADAIRTMMQTTCTITEATRLVGVSRRTIYNWIARGKVQWVRVAGGQPRIVKASLFRNGP